MVVDQTGGKYKCSEELSTKERGRIERDRIGVENQGPMPSVVAPCFYQNNPSKATMMVWVLLLSVHFLASAKFIPDFNLVTLYRIF